jgi:hypothetical protein
MSQISLERKVRDSSFLGADEFKVCPRPYRMIPYRKGLPRNQPGGTPWRPPYGGLGSRGVKMLCFLLFRRMMIDDAQHQLTPCAGMKESCEIEPLGIAEAVVCLIMINQHKRQMRAVEDCNSIQDRRTTYLQRNS